MKTRLPAHSHPSPFSASSGALARVGLVLMLLPTLAACGQKGDLYLPDPKSDPARDQVPAPVPEPVAPTASGESLEDIDSLDDPRTDSGAELGLDPGTPFMMTPDRPGQ